MGGRVLVGYNGTSDAREAVVWAAREVAGSHASLLVVYPADWPGMASPSGQPIAPGALEAAGEVTARGVDLALTASPGIAVQGWTSTREPVVALLDAADRADLVVVGTRGRGPLATAVLGSVSRSVAARCPLPVVVIPPRTGLTTATAHRPVLVGTDGSVPARAAVSYAADRADRARAPLGVVVCPGDGLPQAEAEGIVAETCRGLAATHPSLVVHARTPPGPPAEWLIAESGRTGMIVVGTSGRTGLQALLMGSVAAEVVRCSQCPVAVITP